MKENLTKTLLCLLIPFLSIAQNGNIADISHISSPYRFLTESSFSAKNLFFDSWVKGKLLLADNSVLKAENWYFNFDKIDHELMATSDFKTIVVVDRREYKAILFYVKDTGYVFKRMTFVNDKDLFQVLVNENSKYSLFKVVHTKLVKAYSMGMYTSAGVSLFDKYQDATEYFIFFPNKEYRVVRNLKKAALERAFAFNPDKEKVSEYLNGSEDKALNEKDLLQLVSYLNTRVN